VAVMPRYDRGCPFWAPVEVARRLTADGHAPIVQHIEFDISGSAMEYEPGDLLAVWPCVSSASVDSFLQRLNLSPGTCHVAIHLAQVACLLHHC
jgi:sulfite reductase (NADPH) flavoprotein alpha-component